MDNFWELPDGEQLDNTGSFEIGGGDFEPIPKNTQLKACIVEAKWDDHEGDYYISLTWEVLDGEYKNRKVFQKIRCEDAEPKKRAKAIKMLAGIDTNAGCKLRALGKKPTDAALVSCLCGKPMLITVQVWEMQDRGMKGNWVSRVAPLSGAPVAQPQAQQAVVQPDYDVPF